MARRAVGGRVGLVLLGHPAADLAAITLGRVAHRGDLILRAEVRGRVAVTVETPTHRQRLGLVDLGHEVDAAVARLAADAAVDVRAVVEEDVVGQVVDADPLDRVAAGERLADRQERRRVGTDLLTLPVEN